MRITLLANILAKHPKTVILLFTFFTVLIGIQAQNIFMLADYTKFLPEDDPSLILWDRINEEFNLGSTIIILINQTNRAHNDVRDPEVLKEMDKVYRVLYENPITDGKKIEISSVNSLSILIRAENAEAKPIGNNDDSIPEEEDAQKINEYMERFEIKSLKGILYTDDFKYAVIIIQLKDGADFNTVLAKVEDAINNEANDETTMTITGTVAMQKAIQETSMQYMSVIFPISILFVSIVLFIFHRSIKGVIIAFMPPAFALILTFGTLGIVAPELTSISVAIVALIMGLGVDYSIHMMNRFADEKDTIDVVERIKKILKSSGKAIFLSTVTTMIGFGSLMISSMSPMVTFGFGCAIGIMFSFLAAIILVPCFSIILRFEKTGRIPKWDKLAHFAVKQRKRIVIIAIFFGALSALMIPFIQSDVNYFDLAPRDIPELNAMFEYSDKFGNGGNFNALLIETDPYGLEDPDVMEAILDMQNEMRKAGASVTSIVDTLDKYNEIKNRTKIIERFSELTDIDNLIFDRIAENGIIDEEHSKTLILVSISMDMNIEDTKIIVEKINNITRSTILPHNGKVSELTGQDAVMVAVNDRLFDEQTRSMLIALILVLAVLIIVFNSTSYGVLTIIPVIFVLMWEPGFLVATDIALSPVTIVVASIMIGIGIDYGVHITNRVREELEKGLNKMDAARTAIEKTGLSLVEAATTTCLGMASIFIVGTPALSEFVIIIIFMTSMSCLAAALLLPMFYDNRFVK